jgi:AmmeMemoRadiSam system protein B
MVEGFLQENRTLAMSRPKAIIVPHAGYQFSGPVAATAYAQLSPIADSIERIVLLGPAHHIGFRGMAVCDAEFFETPLGKVSVDIESVERILSLPQVILLDKAHTVEHSLEVQLPFLQVALPKGFLLTPMVVGDASMQEVAEVLDALWDGPETLIVVSSDLSHYHDYETARALDQETTRWIERRQPERLGAEAACGFVGIRGLLACARRRDLQVKALDVRNSGDTAGPRDEVVGYGAYVAHQ